VKPVPFAYERPGSVEEAVALLAEHGAEAKVLAGGQSLVPALNMRLVRPSLLVDVNRLPLGEIVREDGMLRVGATARQAHPGLSAHPLLAECLPHVGHFVTRNRGTVGGSIAHADVAAELPLALLVAGGRARVRSARGERELAAGDLFLGPFSTSLEPDELLVETVWPVPAEGWGYAFEEFSQRRGDFALCTVAAAVGNGLLRVGLGSVVDHPTLLEVDPEHPGESAAEQVEPWGNVHATPGYLRQLVRVLVDRVVARAQAEAVP
jgi:2-furoyl-CoA dehydrogenase FAD binding subunit